MCIRDSPHALHPLSSPGDGGVAAAPVSQSAKDPVSYTHLDVYKRQVLTLALGIGAATAIFTVVDRVLLSPLQYRDAGRIVTVVTKWKSTGRITPSLTGGDLIDIREQAGLFSAFSPYIGGEVGVQVAGRGEFTGAYWVNEMCIRDSPGRVRCSRSFPFFGSIFYAISRPRIS